MTWNYRILDFGTHYALHGVYYDNDIPHSWTEEPCSFTWDIDEIPSSWSFDRCIEALNKPFIKIRDGKIIDH